MAEASCKGGRQVMSFSCWTFLKSLIIWASAVLYQNLLSGNADASA